MNPTTTYDLRDAILALSRADRANLLALVEREEVTRPYQPSHADTATWQALLRLARSPLRSLDAFLRDKQHGVTRPQWQSAVALLEDFCAEVQPVRRQDQDFAALTALVLRCLVSDMQTRDIPITPKRIIEQLPRLRNAVDAAFPGYLEAGILHRLIRITPVEPIAAE